MSGARRVQDNEWKRPSDSPATGCGRIAVLGTTIIGAGPDASTLSGSTKDYCPLMRLARANRLDPRSPGIARPGDSAGPEEFNRGGFVRREISGADERRRLPDRKCLHGNCHSPVQVDRRQRLSRRMQNVDRDGSGTPISRRAQCSFEIGLRSHDTETELSQTRGSNTLRSGAQTDRTNKVVLLTAVESGGGGRPKMVALG